MANIVETPVYEAGIYRKETTDPVLGGTDSAPANVAEAQLANRTAYFKARLDNSGVETAASESINVNNCTEAGFHYVISTASNRPDGTLNGHVIVSGTSSANLTQVWISQDSNKMFMRRATAGPTFSAWTPINVSGVPDQTFTVNSFLNSWVAAAGSAIVFTRIGNIVHVRGRLQDGQTNLPLFSITPDLWPSEVRQVPVVSNNGSIWVFSILTDGSTSVSNGGSQQAFPGVLSTNFDYHL